MNVVQPPSMTTDDPLPDLIRALRGKAPVDRVRAAKDLGRLGWLARDAMPALVAALKDDDAKVREAAAQAVGQMGPDALPALSAMLGHHDKYVRRNAVWAMGKLGPAARTALRDLCHALKDSDPRTASGAAQALGNMGADAAEAVAPLAEAMRGTNIVLCRLAAKALSQIGPPALATLIAHLQHSDPFVRGESALALGWMGPEAKSAVPFLAQTVRGPRGYDTPSPSSKKASDSVFSGTATPAVVPAPELAGSAEDNCRVYAAQALGRIGPAAARAMSDLQTAAHNGSAALRAAAEQAIRMIQGAE
jgi:HEAT repeat protein